jgi:hypothetical protein
MTRTATATPDTFIQANIETALPGLNEADTALMTGLAQAAMNVGGEHLQELLDTATYGPNSTSHWVGRPDPEKSAKEQKEWSAAVAARAAVVGNLAYRATPANDVAETLKTDQVYTSRRHTSLVTPGDRDRYAQAGSAMLWALARHVTGQSVRRRPDDDNRTPWGYR